MAKGLKWDVKWDHKKVQAINNNIDKTNENNAREVLQEALRRTPIDTHQLKDSAHVKRVGNDWIVEYPEEYAIYVHEMLNNYHQVGEAKFLSNAVDYLNKRLINNFKNITIKHK
jgi:folylpolyglutamate synthase/dihydropteroate synthase